MPTPQDPLKDTVCVCGHDEFHHPAPAPACTQDGCSCTRFDPCALIIRVKDLGEMGEILEALVSAPLGQDPGRGALLARLALGDAS